MHSTARLGSDRFIYFIHFTRSFIGQFFISTVHGFWGALLYSFGNQLNESIKLGNQWHGTWTEELCSTLMERNGINFWNVAWWTPSTWSILIKEMYGNDWLSVLQVGRRDTINSILYCLCSPKGAYGIDFIKRVDPATPIKNTTEHGNESIQFSLNGKNQLHGNQFMEKVLSFPIAWVMICSTKKSIRDKVDGMDRID